MTDDDGCRLDYARSARLSDAGAHGYIAAEILSADGSRHLVLAQLDRIGDERALYDPQCPNAVHEQLGELPLEFMRRIAISSRLHRKPPR
jgi:hypothetical protein